MRVANPKEKRKPAMAETVRLLEGRLTPETCVNAQQQVAARLAKLHQPAAEKQCVRALLLINGLQQLTEIREPTPDEQEAIRLLQRSAINRLKIAGVYLRGAELEELDEEVLRA